MSFIEARLDECVAFGFSIDPAYDTQIIALDNGKEQRNVNRTQALRRFAATYQNFTPTEFAVLLATFHAAAGSAYGFRFKDWSDYQVTLGALGLTPGANLTPVQLVKVYTFGLQSRSRKITKPVAGTVTVYQNGVAKAGTIDTATGLFTPTTNWTAGATVTATFEFDVPVRFESDVMPSEYADRNAITTSCGLVEIIP